MNILNKPQNLVPRSVTSGPLPGSNKIYHHPRGRADIAVPFREIALDPSAGEPPVGFTTPRGPIRKTRFRSICPRGLPRFASPGSRAAKGSTPMPGAPFARKIMAVPRRTALCRPARRTGRRARRRDGGAGHAI